MAFKSGIIGFYRVPTSTDPGKVYALGPQGRPVNDPNDLMYLTGASSIAQAFSYVKDVSVQEAQSKGVTAAKLPSAPAPTFTPTPVATPTPVYNAPAPTYSAPAPTYSASAPTPKPTYNYVKGTDSIDVFDRAGNYITAEKAASIPNFWSHVENLSGPTGFKKPVAAPAPVSTVPTIAPIAATPTVGQNIPGTNLKYEAADIANIKYVPPVSTPAPIVAPKKYVKGTDSIDVFDRTTGKYISAAEAAAIPNFWNQVETLNGPSGFTKPATPSVTAGTLDLGNGTTAPTTVVNKSTIAGSVTSDLPYIKGTDSFDIFDKATGRYISAEEAASIPNFWTKVEYSNQALDHNIYKKISDADLNALGQKFDVNTEKLPAAVNSDIKNVQTIFGTDWKPADIFVQKGLVDKGIVGAVRIDGSNDVYTIGSGGGLETPESYQAKFGTLDQKGIVGVVNMATAAKLGIVPNLKKSLDEILKPIDFGKDLASDIAKNLTGDTIIPPITELDSPDEKAKKMAAIVEQEKVIAGVDAAKTALATATANLTTLLTSLPTKLQEVIDSEEKKLLLNEKSAAIASAMTAFNTVKTQYDQYINKIQDREAPVSAIYTQQARVRSQAAIELSGLAAAVDVANGQYTLGKARLDDYIKTWTDSQDWLIKAAQVQIESLGTNLTTAQQEAKDAATMKLNVYIDQYNSVKDTQNEVKQLMLAYPAAGVKISDTWDQAYNKVSPYIQSAQEFKDKIELLKATPSSSSSNNVSFKELPGPDGKKHSYAMDSQGNIVKDYGVVDAQGGTSADALEKAKSVLDAINALKTHPGIDTGTGLDSTLWTNIPGTDAYDFKLKTNALKAMLTIENLGIMKGVLSDTDVKILTGAATSLDLGMTRDQFETELTRITDKMTAVVNGTASGSSKSYSTEIDEAVRNGYKPEEIINYLKNDANLSPKIKEAESNGYTPQQIIDYLKGFKTEGSVSINAQKTAEAIGKYESGGNYSALGKITASGDRAYGKYQVMGNNIPSWTKEVLGKSMTPQEFLADHAAQDKVAQVKLGKYLETYGTLADAASLWFSGRPVAKAGNAADINGTTVPQYIKNIQSIYNSLG